MGLLSWLFPSPDDRVAKARRLIEAGRFVDARDEVLDLDRDDARALVVEANQGLVRMNLTAAVSWAEADDAGRVAIHMGLVEDLHTGGLEEEIRTARRQIREIRLSRDRDAALAKQERETRLLSVDPLGISGGRGLLDGPPSEDVDAPDDEEREARLALLIEQYPAQLRGAVAALGADFGRAVLDLDDGRPDLALPELLGMPDDVALVRWERSRAAYVLGDPTAAAKELRAFAALAGGHQEVGANHTGVLLAQYVAEAGDLPGALEVLRQARRSEPRIGGVLYAQLLEATGALPEAEAVLRDLIRNAPRSDGLYKLLARVRLKGGHRGEAIAALEAAMRNVCDTPGKCGYKPPDREVVRDLAILYLEEGSDPRRGLELADTAAKLEHTSDWHDVYLDTLVARANRDPSLDDRLEVLWDHTPAQHPGRERLQRFLPLPAELGPPQ